MSQARTARPSAAEPSQRGLAALESLARASRQVALYGPEHPMAVGAIEDACQKWSEEAGGQTAEVRADETGLLWNGQPLPQDSGSASRMCETMRERLIAAIHFDPQVRREELVRVLLLLAEEPQRLAELGGAGKVLGREAKSIRLEALDVGRGLAGSEAEWIGEAEEVGEAAAESLAEIVRFCRASAEGEAGRRRWGERPAGARPAQDSAGGVGKGGPPATGAEAVSARVAQYIQVSGEAAGRGGPEGWEQWRADIVEHLGKLTPEWRAGVFRAPTEITPGEPDMLELIAGGMSAEECASLVMDQPGAIRSEPSRNLALVLSRILPDEERRKVVAPLIRRQAVLSGISEAAYDNTVGPLMPRKRDEARRRVALRPEEAAGKGAPSREDESGLAELLATTSPEAVGRSRLETLFELMEAGLDRGRRERLFDVLAKKARRLGEEGDSDQLLMVLQRLRRAAEAGPEHPEESRAAARRALAASGTARVVASVREALDGASGEKADELISLLARLKEKGLASLVEMACQPEEERLGVMVAAIVGEGESAAGWLRKLLSSVQVEALGRVVGAVIATGEAEAAAQLSVLAEHASASVRLALVRAVRASGEAGAGRLLVRLLRDPSLEVVGATISALGKLRVRETAAILSELLSRQSWFGWGKGLKAAIVAALGEMGGEAAAAGLSRALLERGLLAWLFGSSVRTAAAEQLGRIGGQRAEEALQRGARGGPAAVRAACREALARLQARPAREGGDGD